MDPVRELLGGSPVRSWTVQDALELYNVETWGAGFFGINKAGNVTVNPSGVPGGEQVDLKELVDDLIARGLEMPLLLRFSGILRARVATLANSFQTAMKEWDYKGSYRGVYPIKVNQQRHVVEELVQCGRQTRLGLEAGSKPELLVALALLDDPEALIVCNGYKDLEYIETALLARKLGRNTVLVIDRFEEIEDIIAASAHLGVMPVLGVRARLASKGAGKWVESTGDRSKFGLTAVELVRCVERLRKENMLSCLQMLHFHIGSQITAIRAIKDALREASRVYVELFALGAQMKYFDVGGGLGVDYDGSRSSFHSSMNYTDQEYANDVVGVIATACNEREIPHPTLVTESGRALAAHHSVLIFNVLGVNEMLRGVPPSPSEQEPHEVVANLYEVWKDISRKNYQQAFHDAVQLKEEATSLFAHGYLDLVGRARVDELFWASLEKIGKIVRDLDYVPDELEGLGQTLSDTYYCNFSVFQSIPDHWAVKHLFPTMPIHRLNEKPSRRGVLFDLTCDSDGKVDQFIDLHDVKDMLELHQVDPKNPYYLGVFLLGAYQEILGDLHNLFGDANCVHVSVDEHGYRIDHVVKGDSVTEVLSYMQYERPRLVERVRQAAEQAVRAKKLTLEESKLLMRYYENSLDGYTYLEGGKSELPQHVPSHPGGNGRV